MHEITLAHLKQRTSNDTNKQRWKCLHRCRRSASNDSSHSWTSSREGMRLFSDTVASVVRRRIKLAARDLKSFALEKRIQSIINSQTKPCFISIHYCCFGFLLFCHICCWWITYCRYTIVWIVVFTNIYCEFLKKKQTNNLDAWLCIYHSSLLSLLKFYFIVYIHLWEEEEEEEDARLNNL